MRAFFAVLVSGLVIACASKPPPRPPPASPRPAEADVARALRGQACGRAEDAPVVRQRWPHGSSDLCDAALTTWFNVPHADRSCTSDADCVLVAGSCFVDTLNRAAKAKVKYSQLPCANPAAGACTPWDAEARCRGGCCTTERR